jgi:hypothetical protein
MGNAVWIEHALIVLPYAAYGGMLLFERTALGNPMFITWSIYAVACMTTGTALAIECHMAQSSKRRGSGSAVATPAPGDGAVAVGAATAAERGHEEMMALDVSGLATVPSLVTASSETPRPAGTETVPPPPSLAAHVAVSGFDAMALRSASGNAFFARPAETASISGINLV